jgi:protein phosphatase PTC7
VKRGEKKKPVSCEAKNPKFKIKGNFFETSSFLYRDIERETPRTHARAHKRKTVIMATTAAAAAAAASASKSGFNSFVSSFSRRPSLSSRKKTARTAARRGNDARDVDRRRDDDDDDVFGGYLLSKRCWYSAGQRRLSSLTASSSSSSVSASTTSDEEEEKKKKKSVGSSSHVSTVDASAILVPHPDKSATGGEDSCFVLKRSNAFGVFDGVGGWSDEGVNPAEYSETFASEAAKAVTKEKMRNPVDIMVRAHEETRVIGSSTACVCVVEEGEATFANLGDAGGIVARNGACVFKTEPMQHEFNMPFQLGWREAYPETDDPRKADVKKVRLKRGDCVVLGSDGLWDNVPHEDVAILCEENEGDAVKCAEQIARLAFARSTDEEYDSPFMIAARREGMELTWAEKLQGVQLTGGKMDDIAVVVAFVG